MISTAPISTSPISAAPSASAPPAADPDVLTDSIMVDEYGTDGVLRNVLGDAFVAAMPNGDALVVNVLDAGFGGQAAASGGLRAKALASDSALLSPEFDGQILSLLKERVLCRTDANAQAKLIGNLPDGAAFQDAVGAAWSLLAASAGSSEDSSEATVRRMAQLADVLNALGGVNGKLTALAAVAVAATLIPRFSSGWNASAFDQAEVMAEAESKIRAVLALADAAQADDDAAGNLQFLAIASDSAGVVADPAAALSAVADLEDGAAVYVTLRTGNLDFSGWVLNCDLQAITEYRNAQFESIVMFKGKTYAAGDGGIFLLEGDTDDGAKIDAWFTPFLTDFGSSRFKKMPDAWIGADGAGNLFVKVLTRDPATGLPLEDWYKVLAKQGAGVEPGRVEIGRGLKSTFWGLTVANVNGADFKVDEIELRPLILDRRQ